MGGKRKKKKRWEREGEREREREREREEEREAQIVRRHVEVTTTGKLNHATSLIKEMFPSKPH